MCPTVRDQDNKIIRTYNVQTSKPWCRFHSTFNGFPMLGTLQDLQEDK